ncbi:MAG: hypothetical protein GXO26_08800 [Crenarchaeota archaeon]|nr:hypothetical protein [Thermoproteota archaeon]
MPTKEVEYENDIYSIHAKLAFDMADLVIGDYNVVLSSSRKKHVDVDEYGSSLLSVILYYLMLYRSNWKEIDTSIGINIEELFDYIDSMQYALDYLVVEIPKATAEYIVKSMTKTIR